MIDRLARVGDTIGMKSYKTMAYKSISWGAAFVGVIAIAFGVSAAIPTKTEPMSKSVSVIGSENVQENVQGKTQSVEGICANTPDLFNQDESLVLAGHYFGSPDAGCMFVGCGGVI
jgi:hypothetical protein